ncbi:MAG TPA: DUF2523 domain-containing protein [Noviherbaspirillum sp.]|jgi:hypothetical protein|uniref:DUF2523 domain-containing protein n=1 Tax=Noviherbaspirillum sp. TaxID=1926288 RepID=UPI002F95EB19
MAHWIAALLGGLAAGAGSIVGRVLLALGIGYLTFSGVGNLGEWVLDQMKGALSGLPADALGFLAFLWVDKGITMIFSAWVAALTFKMGGSDTITSMIVRKTT